MARVLDPQREINCPVYEWDFGDGCISRAEQDCDPYEAQEDRRQVRVFQPLRYHVFHRPGQYEIKFTVDTAGRKLSGSVSVVVTGASLKDPEVGN